MVALTTDGVILLDPNAAPANGPKAVRAVWQQAVSAAKSKVTIANKETVIAGDFAWRIGAVAHKLPNGAVVNRGQFLEIWRRVDGGWKIHRRMSSGDLATPPKLQPRPIPADPVLDKPGN